MENIFRLVIESMARHGEVNGSLESSPHLGAFAGSGNSTPEVAPSLLSQTLARPGGSIHPDQPRLEWSRWFRIESSFSALLVPAKPGIFALGEEMVSSSENSERGAFSQAKRMIVLFQIAETDDLGMALGRLFLPRNPLLEKLNSGRCFARYAVIEDAAQRSAACETLRRWMQDSAETASGIASCGAGALAREIALTEAAPSLSGAPSLSRSLRQGGEVGLSRIQHETPGSEIPVRASQPSTSSAWGVRSMEANVTQAPNREAKDISRRPTPLPSGF